MTAAYHRALRVNTAEPNASMHTDQIYRISGNTIHIVAVRVCVCVCIIDDVPLNGIPLLFAQRFLLLFCSFVEVPLALQNAIYVYIRVLLRCEFDA